MADLYDHPLEFYVYGCFTNGAFDTGKCAALGYNEAQIAVITQYLADNPDGVAAAVKAAEDWIAARQPAASAATEEAADSDD